jgi:hypothetical protein
MYRPLVALALTFMTALPAFAADCRQLTNEISFCPQPDAWIEANEDLPDGMMVWVNETVVGKVIMEGHQSGTAPGADEAMEMLKQSIRQSLDNPEDITFGQHQLFSGKAEDRGIISYDLIIRGHIVRIHHSFMLADDVMMQFVTYTQSDSEARNLETHRDFVTSFKVQSPEEEA